MHTLKIAALLAVSALFALGCGGSGQLPPDEGDAGIDQNVDPLTCPVPAGPTQVQATTITSPTARWEAAKGPYIVYGDVHIKAGGRLTIDPCTTIELTSGVSITVEEEGVLEALGEPNREVLFESTDPTKPWASLVVSAPGRAKLTYTRLTLGGKTLAGKTQPMVIVNGNGNDGTNPNAPPAAPLFVDHVTLSESFHFGLELRDTARFEVGSTDLTIKNCGGDLYPHALVVNTAALSSVPTVSFKGNRANAIKIRTLAGTRVATDQLLRNRGVPYDVGGQGDTGTLVVSSGNPSAPATLTVEPGVTLRFAKDAKLVVEDPGADPTFIKNATGVLAATGTVDKPITFTSSEDPKQPGDWAGVIYGGKPNANNRLDSVTIAWAGGNSSGLSALGCNVVGATLRGDAAVLLPFEPTAAFLKNSSIQHSAAHGVQRAWAGDTRVSFVSTDANNQFYDVAGCHETTPRQLDGTCPTTVECPK